MIGFLTLHLTVLCEGDMGVYIYGIIALSFFVASGISVILILMCGIAVSSSPVVYRFSSFWLTVFGKRRSFMVIFAVPFICIHLLSNTGRYNVQLLTNSKENRLIKVNIILRLYT